jgi:hypothetical protein
MKNITKLINKAKDLIAQKKNKVAVGVGGALLAVGGVACGPKPATCNYETDELKKAETELNDAQKEEKRLGDEFNINADSCIHYFGNQMPEGWVKQVCNGLEKDSKEKDTVDAIVSFTYTILPMVEKSNPRYPVVEGMIRTGNKSLDAHPKYLVATGKLSAAKEFAEAMRLKLQECQMSR